MALWPQAHLHLHPPLLAAGSDRFTRHHTHSHAYRVYSRKATSVCFYLLCLLRGWDVSDTSVWFAIITKSFRNLLFIYIYMCLFSVILNLDCLHRNLCQSDGWWCCSQTTVTTKPRKVKRAKTSSIPLSCHRPTRQTTASTRSLTTTTTAAPLEVLLYMWQAATTHYTHYALYSSFTHHTLYTELALPHTTHIYSSFTNDSLYTLGSLPHTTHIMVFTKALHIRDFQMTDSTHQRLCLSLRDYLDVGFFQSQRGVPIYFKESCKIIMIWWTPLGRPLKRGHSGQNISFERGGSAVKGQNRLGFCRLYLFDALV